MDPQQKAKAQKIAIVPLLGVLAAVVWNSLRQSGALGGGAAPAPAVLAPAPAAPGAPGMLTPGRASAAPVADVLKADGAGSRIPYTAEADGIRNPFADLLPPEAVAAAKAEAPTPAPAPVVWPAVSLQGIIWGGKDPQAIIDGQLYRVGNTVQGMKVVTITRSGVNVEMQGATTQLTVTGSQAPMVSPQGPATGLMSPYPSPSRFPGGER